MASAGHGSPTGTPDKAPRKVVAAVAPGTPSRAAQQATSAPFGLEMQSHLNGDPNVRLYDTCAVTWDQSMLDSWGVPWEFDSLLVEGNLTFIEQDSEV